jgi:hypothetical protein
MAALWAVAMLTLAIFAHAESRETQPFAGVRYIAHAQREPYPLAWHLIIIDPKAPGIRFATTAPDGDRPRETKMETTRDFAVRTGVQVAVNASFFATLNTPTTEVLSLAVSEGTRYSPWSKSLPWGFNIDAGNRATVIRMDEEDPSGFGSIPPVALYHAVAGNVRVVARGACAAPEVDARHPRTAAGVTAAGEILLLVVDGRHGAHSRGATYAELARILLDHGAEEAINLDGGGSSTLVIADPEPRVVNVPMPLEARESAPLPPFPLLRPVGNNLGVYAAPAE